jgi:hypothetical protein
MYLSTKTRFVHLDSTPNHHTSPPNRCFREHYYIVCVAVMNISLLSARDVLWLSVAQNEADLEWNHWWNQRLMWYHVQRQTSTINNPLTIDQWYPFLPMAYIRHQRREILLLVMYLWLAVCKLSNEITSFQCNLCKFARAKPSKKFKHPQRSSDQYRKSGNCLSMRRHFWKTTKSAICH